MALSKRQIRTLFVVGLVLGMVATAAASTFLDNSVPVNNGVPIGVSGGPTVVLEGQADVNLTDFYDGNTLTLNTSRGNITFHSTVNTNATIHVDKINGTWTDVTGIDAPNTNLTINPEDKPKIGVRGDIDSINFTDYDVTDESTDFVYSGSGTDANIIVYGATANEQYGLIDQSTKKAVDVDIADSNGKLNFSDPPLSTHTVSVQKLGNLTIRNESVPHDKITKDAEVTFYEDSDDDPVIKNFTVTNGEIDLSGLPVDTEFAVAIRVSGYHNRTVLVEDLGTQNTVFLLNETAIPSVENRFTVSDRTGDFPAESTEIIVQRAINRSVYGGSPSGFAWVNMGGDDLGSDEAYTIDLEEDVRYRIKVQNDDGDVRILGSYTPTTTGTIELRVGSVVIDPEEPDTVGWSANRTNVTGAPVRVNFEYNDSTDNTNTIWLEIHEYGNESNVLLANTSFTGPFGTFSHTEDVPSAQNDTEWVVKWTAERDGENLQAQVVTGPQGNLLGDMPDWLMAIVFVGSTLMIGGLASQLNGKVMGIAMAGWAGMFWVAGVVPNVLGGGVIALSMVVAAIMFVRESRGGL